MAILYVTYALDGLLTIALPIALAIYLTRKYGLYWSLFWIGAAIFALAEIGLASLNNYVIYPFLSKFNLNSTMSAVGTLIISAAFLSLCGALVHQLLRYGMFRWWAKDARSWVDGVLTGIGIGGAGAIFLGALVIYNFINMAMFRNSDLSSIVPLDQLTTAQAQMAAYWSAPWYTTFNDIVQQLFILPVQICLALIILQAFMRKQWFWILIAIGAQTLFETSRIVAQNLLAPYWMDLMLAGFGIAAVVLIFALRPSDTTRNPASSPVKV